MTSSSASSKAASRQYVGIDLLRICASLLVVMYHLGGASWIDQASESGGILHGMVRYPEILPLIPPAAAAVPLFFAISGFVITGSVETATASRFAVGRLLRLLPAVWICGSVSFAVALALSPEGVGTLVVRYLHTMLISPAPRWIDGVFWTLPIELAFYAIVWLCLARKRLAQLETIMLWIGLLSGLIWILAATNWVPGLATLANKRAAQLLLLTHGCEFALGVLGWRLVHDGVTLRRALGFLGCVVGSLFQVTANLALVLREHDLGAPNLAPQTLFVAVVVLLAVTFKADAAIVSRIPSRVLAVIRVLAAATFPLYLLHTFVGSAAMWLAATAGLSRWPVFACGFAVSLAAAVWVITVIEPAVSRRIAPFVKGGCGAIERRFARRRPVVA